MLLNLMSSPGSGKTSLYSAHGGSDERQWNIGVIEADIDPLLTRKSRGNRYSRRSAPHGRLLPFDKDVASRIGCARRQ